MKRVGHLYEHISDYDNLLAAFAAVRRGHRSKADIQLFEKHLASNLHALGEDLRQEEPGFGDYHFFKVYDPKERQICAAAVRERVIHHAIIQVCGATMERSLIADCFACRKGYGQFRAIERAQQFSRKHAWFLKMDVAKYFDSIDHAILLSLLARCFKDSRLLRMFELLLESYCTEPGKGLPIGNLTSQYFANLYLDGFDHYARETLRVPGYVRYMDDMVIFGEKDELKSWSPQVVTWMSEERQLTLKQGGGYLNRCDRGLSFLGFRVFPRRLLLTDRSRRRFVRKLGAYDLELAEGIMTEAAYQRRSTALFSFVAHADTLGFRRKVLGAGQRLQPGETGRQLEQQREQLPGVEPQQQHPVQPKQQQRVPAGSPCSSMARLCRRSTTRSASSSRLAGTKSDNGAGLVAAGERPAAYFPIVHVFKEKIAA
jgi:RNA-directed DNA polymerase